MNARENQNGVETIGGKFERLHGELIKTFKEWENADMLAREYLARRDEAGLSLNKVRSEFTQFMKLTMKETLPPYSNAPMKKSPRNGEDEMEF